MLQHLSCTWQRCHRARATTVLVTDLNFVKIVIVVGGDKLLIPYVNFTSLLLWLHDIINPAPHLLQYNAVCAPRVLTQSSDTIMVCVPSNTVYNNSVYLKSLNIN